MRRLSTLLVRPIARPLVGRLGMSRRHFAAATQSGGDGLAHLEDEHAKMEDLFMRYEHANPAGKKQALSELTELLCQHAAIEELVFYPRAKERTGDALLINRFLLDHQAVKETLYFLNSEERDNSPQIFDATIKKLRMNLDEHKHYEEQLFDALRKNMTQQELAELDKDLKDAEKTAPTAPHPMAPTQGVLGQMAQKGTGMMEQMMKKAKDTMSQGRPV